jgi:hypothetical protein
MLTGRLRVQGAVAGAWGTIFAGNAMAGQSYKMKLRQVKEFCKVKALPWGVRAKLVAHYEHLYPDEVIVEELEIVNDLPAVMREELVREMCEFCPRLSSAVHHGPDNEREMLQMARSSLPCRCSLGWVRDTPFHPPVP